MEPRINRATTTALKTWGTVLFIGVLALFGFKYVGKNNTEVITPIENNTPVTTKESKYELAKPVVTNIPVTTNVNKYKNGTYSAEGLYVTPAGPEKVNITVTLENNLITSALFKGNATNPNSVKWQGEFSEGFTTEVVGKNIDEVELTVVNGSSLTPKGFLDALEKIKAEAIA